MEIEINALEKARVRPLFKRYLGVVLTTDDDDHAPDDDG